VLGLLPGLDNFSHIGGFLMGLVLGVCILHSPSALRRRINQDEPPYTQVQNRIKDGDGVESGVQSFLKSPVGFFKGRKPLWWAWWIIRAAALTTVLVIFIVLLNNFYVYRKTCSWCKYLSCLVSLMPRRDKWLLLTLTSRLIIGVISATCSSRISLRRGMCLTAGSKWQSCIDLVQA
jgi:hypothetical protein